MAGSIHADLNIRPYAFSMSFPITAMLEISAPSIAAFAIVRCPSSNWLEAARDKKYKVLRYPWAPCVTSLFFGRNGLHWEVWGFDISLRDLNVEPLSWFGRPFLEGQKMKAGVEFDDVHA